MAWQDRCRHKILTASAAVALIRRGEHLFLSDGSATPLGILPALVAPDAHLGDHEITHLLTLGDAPYARPEWAGRFRHNALFIGPNVRQAVSEGRADYTPVFLSEIPHLIRQRRIECDVAIISVTPPDDEGWCSLGTHVSIIPAALSMARLIIAQVNPRMPRTGGPFRLHVDQIHAMVEVDHALPELRPAPDRPETAAIAQHVAELVSDGSTLQLGIGGIPNGVLRLLKEHNDLGIHTEMFSDGVVELARLGVINGRRKTLDPGKIVTGFMMGTQVLYDFVHENPTVEVHPSDYVNDPFVIARNDHMVAINTALEIDLTGQVCADSIGDRFFSGIGGQVDFIRGAARSRGGRPIIALPSTACDGAVSRIVPRLGDGAGVVTTRGDVHFVVTEYGVADLHGRSVRERAMALIAIAHPKFRPWLIAEARQRRYVYVDQVEPPVRVPIYPRELEKMVTLRDGASFLIRPVKTTDEDMLHDMFYALSEMSVYQRFFAVKKFMPYRRLQQFCTIDYDNNMTLVAVRRDGHAETVVGMAMYARAEGEDLAEAAVVVVDAYQGRGLGSAMMDHLRTIARQRGLRGFHGDTLADNIAMLKLFDRCGRRIETTRSGDVLSVRVLFEDRP